MNPFRIYPQHPDAHEGRPWWRRAQVFAARSFGADSPVWDYQLPVAGYVRSDGKSLAGKSLAEPPTADDLAAFDAADPLPCPPPLLGQSWVYPGGMGCMVVQVVPLRDGWDVALGAGSKLVLYRIPDDLPLGMAAAWPPEGAVLVAGPCAPWAPLGWTP